MVPILGIRVSEVFLKPKGGSLFQSIIAFLIAFFFLHSGSSEARVFLYVDIDGTVFEYRKEFAGTFDTPYKLFRVTDRGFATQDSPEGPKVVEISMDEFDRLDAAGALARGELQLGSLNTFFYDKAGHRHVAGHYMVRYPETYDGFLPASDAKTDSPILRDFKIAQSRDPQGRWAGMVYGLLADYYLADARRAENVGVITARGQNLVDLFKYLKKNGYIQHLPNFEQVYNLSDPQFDWTHRRDGIGRMKLDVIRKIVKDLQAIPFDPAKDKKILNDDGTDPAEAFTFIFAEDNPVYVEMIAKFMQDAARRKNWTLTPIKFILINAGTDEQVERAGRPRFSVPQANGIWREAKDEELLGELPGAIQLSAQDRVKYGLPSVIKRRGIRSQRWTCATVLSSDEAKPQVQGRSEAPVSVVGEGR